MVKTYTQGERVRTPLGLGTVAYQRLAAPDYREAEAVSVVLDSERARAGYVGTILPAADVEPLPAPAADGVLRCDAFERTADGARRCTAPVTHVDRKGYAYCTPHGRERRATMPCRQLLARERAQLQAGGTISYERRRRS
jgi:hypothetical protein